MHPFFFILVLVPHTLPLLGFFHHLLDICFLYHFATCCRSLFDPKQVSNFDSEEDSNSNRHLDIDFDLCNFIAHVAIADMLFDLSHGSCFAPIWGLGLPVHIDSCLYYGCLLPGFGSFGSRFLRTLG